MVNESTNVVDNCVLWDGNPNTWKPPAGNLMLVEATTLAIVWSPVVVDKVIVDYVLAEIEGAGDIGFTWNTTTQILTTNQPKPAIPVTE